MTYRNVNRSDIIEAIQVVFSNDINFPSDTVTWVSPGTTHSVNENSAFSVSLSATSLYGGGVYFAIVGGADAALFHISGNTLSMTAKDYEVPTDSNTDNVYTVTIRAYSIAGVVTGYADRTFNVTVSNVGVSWTNNSIDVGLSENDSSTTFNISSYATSGTAPYTFSKLNWGDSAYFNVSSIGIISLVGAFDYENPNDSNHDNIYTFKIRATDAQGEIQDVTVNVTISNVGVSWTTSSISLGLYEADGATTFDISTYATGGTTPYIFTKIAGGDASFFNVSSGGIISLVSALDYESASDADHNNVYTFQIRATDAQSETKDITVNITLSDIATPSWTESPINRNVSETNSGYTLNLSTLVAGPGTKTYSLLNTGDYTKFSLTSGGTLSLVGALDYENPTDSNTDNVYTITARVTNTTTLEYANVTVNITITDSPNPTWSENPIEDSVDENTSYSIDLSSYLSSGTGSKTYTKSGADAGLFTLNSSTGLLTLTSTKNYESPVDANTNNVYTVNIRATDSVGEYGDTVFNLTVNNVPETTFFTFSGLDIDNGVVSTSAALNLSHGRVVFDVNDVIVFSDNGGDPRQKIVLADDDGSATITLSATGGNITLGSVAGLSYSGNGTPDIEMTGSIANLNAAFEGLSLTLNTTELLINTTISISISQYNTEHITWVTSSSQSIEENAQFLATLSATGSEGGTPSFTISGGADASKFSIVDGDLIMAAKDYEAPTDADTNNIYVVQVHATTEAGVDPYYAGGSSYRTFTVTVTNVVISWTNPSTSVPENSAVSIELDSYVSGGTGPYTFSIPSSYDYSGWSISTIDDVHYLEHDPFNYESPTDGDANNVYRVPVIAYDSNSEPSSTYSVYVTITNVGPAWTGGTIGTTVAENSALNYDITSHVSGGTAPYVYVLNALYDHTGFSITDGVIEHDNSFNYEAPSDANGDNVYRLNVTVTDDIGEPASKDIYITVTNVDDIGDSITLSGSDVVLETTNYIYHTESTPFSSDVIYFGPSYGQRVQITGDGSTPYTELRIVADNTGCTFGTTTGLTFTAGSNGDDFIELHGTLANINAALDTMYLSSGVNSFSIGLGINPTTTPEDAITVDIVRFNSLYEVQKIVPTGGNIDIKLRNDSSNTPVTIPENSTAEEIQTLLRADIYIINGEGSYDTITTLWSYLGWGNNLTVYGAWSTGFFIVASYRGNLPTLSATNATVTVLNNGDQAELIHLTGSTVSDNQVTHQNSTPLGTGGEAITFDVSGAPQSLKISGDKTGTSTLKIQSSTAATITLGSTTGLTFTAGGNGTTTMTFYGTIANINNALNGLVLSACATNTSFTLTLNEGVTYQTHTKTVSVVYVDRTEVQYIGIYAGLYVSDYLASYNYLEDVEAGLAAKEIGPGLQPTAGQFNFTYSGATISLPYTVPSASSAAYLQNLMRGNSTWRIAWGALLTVTGDYESGFTITASENGNLSAITASVSTAEYNDLIDVAASSATSSDDYGGTNNWTNLSNITGEPDGYLGTATKTSVDLAPTYSGGIVTNGKAIAIKFSDLDLPQHTVETRTKQINGIRFYIACPIAANDSTANSENQYVNSEHIIIQNWTGQKFRFGVGPFGNPQWQDMIDYLWESDTQFAAGSTTDLWDNAGIYPTQSEIYTSLITYDGILVIVVPNATSLSATYAHIEAARLKINWSYPYGIKTFTIREGSTL